MIRFSTIFFCLILAAAAVGRYRAEAGVRAERDNISRIEQQIDRQRAKISKLQLEVEVLESPKRLTELGATRDGLRPIQPRQVLTAEKFAALMGEENTHSGEGSEHFIADAIVMADIAGQE